jgi:hypothetical protein
MIHINLGLKEGNNDGKMPPFRPQDDIDKGSYSVNANYIMLSTALGKSLVMLLNIEVNSICRHD